MPLREEPEHPFGEPFAFQRIGTQRQMRPVHLDGRAGNDDDTAPAIQLIEPPLRQDVVPRSQSVIRVRPLVESCRPRAPDRLAAEDLGPPARYLLADEVVCRSQTSVDVDSRNGALSYPASCDRRDITATVGHMNPYRSRITTQGRTMAGARSLWRATGMKDADFNKPIIAIANSFTQFVPGHVHLHDVGQRVKQVIDAAGGYGVEFNTIAVDDGIAMGHGGMLYSLPSRDLIADSVEYMVEAHVADALLCISNCDKITPGMLMAAMRLNIPTIFVSGGPMEAGTSAGTHDAQGQPLKIDLIDAMVAAGDNAVADERLLEMERSACPTCGSCSGLFTANSMNCLNEALGLALPGNGTLLATHKMRWSLFEEAARQIVALARRYYVDGDRQRPAP